MLYPPLKVCGYVKFGVGLRGLVFALAVVFLGNSILKESVCQSVLISFTQNLFNLIKSCHQNLFQYFSQ